VGISSSHGCTSRNDGERQKRYEKEGDIPQSAIHWIYIDRELSSIFPLFIQAKVEKNEMLFPDLLLVFRGM
jgi:hypothetical protein